MICWGKTTYNAFFSVDSDNCSIGVILMLNSYEPHRVERMNGLPSIGYICNLHEAIS